MIYSKNTLIVFGTRPEAIKMAPICFELNRRNIAYKLCVTAQHREMLDQVLDFFQLVPDYDLNLMKPNQSLNALSARILVEVGKVLISENFDLVLVHGDTTTSSMVALAAFHNGIKVGHIEAGLRTYNKQAPFPEELNRQITGRIANYHFAPTQEAKQNLLSEKIKEATIIITGNTVIDALKITLDRIEKGYSNSQIENLKRTIDFNKKIILVTGHRRESFGKGFENICEAILEISNTFDVEIIYPVHLNPNVVDVVYATLASKNNIHLIKPLDYPSFIWLMSQSDLIISDSGGVQEEAPTLGVPVLVTRQCTERSEGIKTGASVLVGTDVKKIVKETTRILKSTKNIAENSNPYGDGSAAKKIVEFINNIDI